MAVTRPKRMTTVIASAPQLLPLSLTAREAVDPLTEAQFSELEEAVQPRKVRVVVTSPTEQPDPVDGMDDLSPARLRPRRVIVIK